MVNKEHSLQLEQLTRLLTENVGSDHAKTILDRLTGDKCLFTASKHPNANHLVNTIKSTIRSNIARSYPFYQREYETLVNCLSGSSGLVFILVLIFTDTSFSVYMDDAFTKIFGILRNDKISVSRFEELYGSVDDLIGFKSQYTKFNFPE